MLNITVQMRIALPIAVQEVAALGVQVALPQVALEEDVVGAGEPVVVGKLN